MTTEEILENIINEVRETRVALDTREETLAFEDGMRYVRQIVERYLKIIKKKGK